MSTNRLTFINVRRSSIFKIFLLTLKSFVDITLGGYYNLCLRYPFADDTQTPYDVIISAYMNSGSTFAGKMLGHRPDAFYFYEPLWRLSLWGYYTAENTLCSSRMPLCRCRKYFAYFYFYLIWSVWRNWKMYLTFTSQKIFIPLDVHKVPLTANCKVILPEKHFNQKWRRRSPDWTAQFFF